MTNGSSSHKKVIRTGTQVVKSGGQTVVRTSVGNNGNASDAMNNIETVTSGQTIQKLMGSGSITRTSKVITTTTTSNVVRSS